MMPRLAAQTPRGRREKGHGLCGLTRFVGEGLVPGPAGARGRPAAASAERYPPSFPPSLPCSLSALSAGPTVHGTHFAVLLCS